MITLKSLEFWTLKNSSKLKYFFEKGQSYTIPTAYKEMSQILKEMTSIVKKKKKECAVSQHKI